MGGPGSGPRKTHDGPTRREMQAAREAATAAERKRKRDEVLTRDDREAAAAAKKEQDVKFAEEALGSDHPLVYVAKGFEGSKHAGNRRSGRLKEAEYAAAAAEAAAEAAVTAQPKPNSIKSFFAKASQ